MGKTTWMSKVWTAAALMAAVQAAVADTITVQGSLPYERNPYYAVQFGFQGFNPAWGTLTRVDASISFPYAIQARIENFPLLPPYLPWNGVVKLGAGANFGGYDGTGFVSLVGNVSYQSHTVTIPGRGYVDLYSSGVGSATGTFTSQNILNAFIGAGTRNFYGGRGEYFSSEPQTDDVFYDVVYLDEGATYTFVYTFTPPVPTPPELGQPANNATNVPMTPTMSWTGPRVNHTYRVTIADNAGLNTPLHVVEGLTANSYTVPASVLNGCSTYYWAVDAVNSAGSARSTVFSFSTLSSADFDGDGFISGADFDQYVQAFEAGDMAADFDGDGFVTGVDFDVFVLAFEAGC